MKIAVVFCLWIAMCLVWGCEGSDMNEPQCLSRFDYDYKVLQKLVSLETTQTELQKTIQQHENLIYVLNKSMKAHKENVQQKIEKLVTSRLSDSLRSTYTRWGRTTCPGNDTHMLYEGFAAGSHYLHSGGAANYLCLPNEPKWGHFDETLNTDTKIEGVEYQFSERNIHKFFGRELLNHDAPCAVCLSSRPNMLMIPGRNVCYNGWTLEYHGYLVAGHPIHKGTSEFVCLDVRPEVIEGGDADQNGKLFYFVEAKCGSLKCPPYVNGRELTCVVCTK